jgi:hypothetical protein
MADRFAGALAEEGRTSRLEAPLSATTICVSPESRSHSSETV